MVHLAKSPPHRHRMPRPVPNSRLVHPTPYNRSRMPQLNTCPRMFAIEHHKTQTYAQGLPYAYHLAAVEKILTDIEYRNATAAAWLHDIIEDTQITIDTIAILF